jgi:hypothetical protein
MIAHRQCGCGSSKVPCGCCEGVEVLTPLSVANRPGLNALAYRAGTHATFLESMLARLSTIELEHDKQKFRPLLDLTTREPDDPSIALLDAWGMVADVLTFYQERIANEGYLRTATERRSIIELARLVGYRLRPGVAASVWLALTCEDNEKVVIEPYEVRAQSVPGPGELPQSFENIEKFEARGRWNKLVPRVTQPQSVTTLRAVAKAKKPIKLYLKGITTGLNQNDPLLLVTRGQPDLSRVIEVNADAAADRTQVIIGSWHARGAKKVHGFTIPFEAESGLNARLTAFEEPGPAEPHLNALSDELSAGRTEAELSDFINRETLPGIERVASRRNIKASLRARLRELADDLGNVAASLNESANAAPASALKSSGRFSSMTMASASPSPEEVEAAVMTSVVNGLTKTASVPPANSQRLSRQADKAFSQHSDLGIQALGVFQPALLNSFPVALSNTPISEADQPEVFAFRVRSAPFGHNAQPRSTITETTKETTNPDTKSKETKIELSEWTANDVHTAEEFFDPDPHDTNRTEVANVIYLDGNHDKILPNSWVVVDTSAIDLDKSRRVLPANTPSTLLTAQAGSVKANITRNAYGLAAASTMIELTVDEGAEIAPWIMFGGGDSDTDEFQMIRRTVVYAQAEKLALTEEPIEEDICTTQANGGWIVLDGIYTELKSGRWVIVSGERADLDDGFHNPVSGVKGTELAMIAEVLHDFESGITGDAAHPRIKLPGDAAHTRIKLAFDLEYCYARDKVTIYANVVKATHGETRKEALGSGDGSKSLQQFALKQSPLTYVSAPTPAGVESTLKIFVDDVEWHEAESIFGLRSTDRRFITKRNDAEVTTAIFGNGKQGSRLPTGIENVRAQYRQGIGKPGNVAEGKITLLAARPLSVKEVINPQRATGGADPESRDQARKNTPLAVLALDRLVSTRDYGDFARTFGGVGKAFAVRLSDGQSELVYVTIAGAGDAPIDESSDVLRNLRIALVQFGDPAMPARVAVRELLLLVISAGVRLLPDYVWEKVVPKIRAKMLDTFSFEARELGQDVLLSEVISAIQSVPGVAYVDVDALGGVAERNLDGSVRTPNELTDAAHKIVTSVKPEQQVLVKLPEIPRLSDGVIRPAQLAYLVPEVPDTLILNLIENNEH